MSEVPRPHQYASLAVLFVVTVLTYLALSRGLPGPFLLDDAIRIQSRSIPDLTLSTIAREIDIAGFTAFGRPLSLVSLYVTKYLYGNDPGAFKHENIALHLVTGLVVFWLTYRIVAMRQITAQRAEALNSPLFYATLTTGLWLAHPLSVSTVLYAVQRMTILSALFTFAALLTYTLSRQVGLKHFRAKFGMFALVPVFSLFGILSKENAALIPVYFLLIECFVFRFRSRSRHEARILLAALLLLSALPLLGGVAYFLTHLTPLLNDYAARDFTMSERLGTEAVIVWQYVQMLLLPRLSSMTLYHDAIPLYGIFSPAALIASISWLVIICCAILMRKREPLIGFGILFFVASHLLESTIFPLELMFEHRNYLGSFGLFLVVTHLLARLASSIGTGRKITIGIVVFLIPLLLFQTSTRASTWRNEEHMLLVSLLEHPASDRAASALANLRLRNGHVTSAREVLERAIEMPPHRARQGLRSHLLSTYCVGDETPPDYLYDSLRASVRGEPITAYTISSLDFVNKRKQSKRCDSVPEQLLIQLLESAGDNPQSRETYRFQAHYLSGQALVRGRNFETAISAYRNALEFSTAAPPTWTLDTLIKLADLQIELKYYAEALNTIDRAQRLIDARLVELPLMARALRNQRTVIQAQRSDN